MAAWNTTCGSDPPVSAMEMRAGLRWSAGRERIRDRSARPSDQAVLEVKEGKMTAAEDSWAVSSRGCDFVLVCDCIW